MVILCAVLTCLCVCYCHPCILYNHCRRDYWRSNLKCVEGTWICHWTMIWWVYHGHTSTLLFLSFINLLPFLQLKEFELLDRCLKETLRLRPPIMAMMRLAKTPQVLLTVPGARHFVLTKEQAVACNTCMSCRVFGWFPYGCELECTLLLE